MAINITFFILLYFILYKLNKSCVLIIINSSQGKYLDNSKFDLFILGRDVLEEVQKLLLPILIYVFDKLFVNFNSEVKPEPLDDNTEEFLPF